MNPLIECEDAIVAELRAARRADFPRKQLFNSVDTYAGEQDEVLEQIIKLKAPAAYVRLSSCVNVSKPIERIERRGRRSNRVVVEDMENVIWSIFVCTRSLRNPRELRRGAIGVVGMYEVLDVMLDLQDRNPRLPGRLRNRRLLPNWDTFLFISYELMAQTRWACVFEVQLKTRYQHLNSTAEVPGPTIDGGRFDSEPGGEIIDGGRFDSDPGGEPLNGGKI
ncbi:MAG: phage protein Gp37 [Verrucomicrobiia bacterium]